MPWVMGALPSALRSSCSHESDRSLCFRRGYRHQATFVLWLRFPREKRKLISDIDEKFIHRFTCLRTPGPQGVVLSPFGRSCTHQMGEYWLNHTFALVSNLQLINIGTYCYFLYRSYLSVRLLYFGACILDILFMGNSYNHTTVRKDTESEIRHKECCTKRLVWTQGPRQTQEGLSPYSQDSLSSKRLRIT